MLNASQCAQAYLFSRKGLCFFCRAWSTSLSCFNFAENMQEFNSTELCYFNAAYFLLLLINILLVQTSSSYLMPSVMSQFVADDIQISPRDTLWSHKQRIMPISEWLTQKVIDKANKYLDVSSQSVVICKRENKTADISAIHLVFLIISLFANGLLNKLSSLIIWSVLHFQLWLFSKTK